RIWTKLLYHDFREGQETDFFSIAASQPQTDQQRPAPPCIASLKYDASRKITIAKCNARLAEGDQQIESSIARGDFEALPRLYLHIDAPCKRLKDIPPAVAIAIDEDCRTNARQRRVNDHRMSIDDLPRNRLSMRPR